MASIARLPSSTDDPRASGSTADRHSTLIAELNSIIKGFGPKSVAVWKAKAETAAADAVPKMCGALAARSSEGLSALAKLKIRGVGAMEVAVAAEAARETA